MIDFKIRVDRWLSAEKQLDRETHKSCLFHEDTGLMCCMGDLCSQLGVEDHILAPYGFPVSIRRLEMPDEAREVVEMLIPHETDIAVLNDIYSASELLSRDDLNDYTDPFRQELIAKGNERIGEELRLRILQYAFKKININLIIP